MLSNCFFCVYLFFFAKEEKSKSDCKCNSSGSPFPLLMLLFLQDKLNILSILNKVWMHYVLVSKHDQFLRDVVRMQVKKKTKQTEEAPKFSLVFFAEIFFFILSFMVAFDYPVGSCVSHGC